jgi:hypothetical protein
MKKITPLKLHSWRSKVSACLPFLFVFLSMFAMQTIVPLSMERHPFCLCFFRNDSQIRNFLLCFFRNDGVVGGDHEMKEMMVQVQVQLNGDGGNFSLLESANVGHSGGLYDKPLPCFGCGIGWFS